MGLRAIEEVTSFDIVTNKESRKRLNVEGAVEWWKKRTLEWYGHVLRSELIVRH